MGLRLWDEPITTTLKNVIVDRYDIWELARRQNKDQVLCLQRDLTDDAAIRLMLQIQGRRNSINAYTRIRFAKELVPEIRAQAKLNQQVGGEMKALSKLTGAVHINCRDWIAQMTSVSSGQVAKVLQLDRSASNALIDALLNSEISIHAAWHLSKLSVVDQSYGLRNIAKRKNRNSEENT